MAEKMQRVQTRHALVSYRDSGGAGFPIVMLHGTGMSSDVFEHQFDSRLVKSFRLIAIDLPGHGASSDATDPEVAYTLQGFADAVSDVLSHLNIRRAILFGWSLGGHVAIELLATTSYAAGLVLTGTPPVAKGFVGMLRGMLISRQALSVQKVTFSKAAAARFAEFCVGRPEGQDYAKVVLRSDGRFRPVFAQSLMQGDEPDQREVIERASIPIAMINGSDDPVVRKGYIAGLRYRNLWGGLCHFIADAGHAPFMQKPEQFNTLLEQFAQDVVADLQKPAVERQKLRA